MERFVDIMQTAFDLNARLRPQRGLHVLAEERQSMVPGYLEGQVVDRADPTELPSNAFMRAAIRGANIGTPEASSLPMTQPRRSARKIGTQQVVVEALHLRDIVGDLIDANLDRVWDGPTRQRALELADSLEAMVIHAANSPAHRDAAMPSLTKTCAQIHVLASQSFATAGRLFDQALSEWAVAKIADAQAMVRGNPAISAQTRDEKAS